MQSNPKIPFIDFKKFVFGSSASRLRIATAVDEALSSGGFFYLYNHGIGQHKVDRSFQWVSINQKTFLTTWAFQDRSEVRTDKTPL